MAYLTAHATSPAAGTRQMTATTYTVVPDTSWITPSSSSSVEELLLAGPGGGGGGGLCGRGRKCEVGCSGGRGAIGITSGSAPAVSGLLGEEGVVDGAFLGLLVVAVVLGLGGAVVVWVVILIGLRLELGVL